MRNSEWRVVAMCVCVWSRRRLQKQSHQSANRYKHAATARNVSFNIIREHSPNSEISSRNQHREDKKERQVEDERIKKSDNEEGRRRNRG